MNHGRNGFRRGSDLLHGGRGRRGLYPRRTQEEEDEETGEAAVKELIDEVEEGIDLFIDASQDSEPEVAIEDDTELVFTEESGSGFTIGQLLSEELKKKFSLNEEEKKKK